MFIHQFYNQNVQMYQNIIYLYQTYQPNSSQYQFHYSGISQQRHVLEYLLCNHLSHLIYTLLLMDIFQYRGNVFNILVRSYPGQLYLIKQSYNTHTNYSIYHICNFTLLFQYQMFTNIIIRRTNRSIRELSISDILNFLPILLNFLFCYSIPHNYLLVLLKSY